MTSLARNSLFSAILPLLQVETDKAVVDFEAQEDGYLAKIIIDAGPQEVALGSVIAIVVEEESDVPAFKDFKVEQNVAAPAPPAAAEKPAAPQSQPQAAAPQTQAPPAAASAPRAQEMPAPVPAAPVAPPTAIPAPSASTQSISTAEDADSYVAFPNWGKSLDRSPFASTFLQKQKEYVEKYGFAGQDLE